jgi:hypothetical protein
MHSRSLVVMVLSSSDSLYPKEFSSLGHLLGPEILLSMCFGIGRDSSSGLSLAGEQTPSCTVCCDNQHVQA